MTTRSVPKVSGGSSVCCISAGSAIGWERRNHS